MLDDYDRLCKEYDAEVSAEYDKKYYLPFGSHLLPQDYQDFICKWNKIMTEESGWWNGQFREDFKAQYPTLWTEFRVENKKFMRLYPAEVAAVKAYQADYVDEDSSTEDFPPLPKSPVVEPACNAVSRCCITPCADGLCCDHCWVLREDDTTPLATPAHVPVPIAAPTPEAVDAIEMVPELTSLLANAEPLPSSPAVVPVVPKAPTKYRPPYNHYNWPSPLPKVFVQQIRGRNAWNYNHWRFFREGAWPQDFKASWLIAGNTEFKLTHENCLRYLAYRCNCSVDEFLLKKPIDVNSKLFSPYSGVKGHFIRRYYY
jgi:hypothetical protein